MAGHVFLSYSRADSAYVHQLAIHLTDSGIPVWIDADIDYGSRWEREIRERIDSCAVLLVVMSPDAEDSTWVVNELARAQSRDKPVLPLLLRGDVFFRLGHLQHEDVTGGTLPTTRFVERLRALVTQAPPAVQPPATRPADLDTPGSDAAVTIAQCQDAIEALRRFEQDCQERLAVYGKRTLAELASLHEADSTRLTPIRARGAEYHSRLLDFFGGRLAKLKGYPPLAAPDPNGWDPARYDHVTKLISVYREDVARLRMDLTQRQIAAWHRRATLVDEPPSISAAKLYLLLTDQVRDDLDGRAGKR